MQHVFQNYDFYRNVFETKQTRCFWLIPFVCLSKEWGGGVGTWSRPTPPTCRGQLSPAGKPLALALANNVYLGVRWIYGDLVLLILPPPFLTLNL